MDSLLLDYEDTLIGRNKSIPSYNFVGPEPGGENQRKALAVIKYAIESVLEWDVEDAAQRFDHYMIKVMKLERMVDYIEWPPEVDYGNPKYVLSLIYPQRFHLDRQKLVWATYEEVLAGRKPFPREYFNGPLGFYRYCACLQYLLEFYKPLDTVDEIYAFFLSPEGNRFLSYNRLSVPAKQFSIDICDAIYEITVGNEYAELMYHFYSFEQDMAKLRKAERKKARMEKKLAEDDEDNEDLDDEDDE